MQNGFAGLPVGKAILPADGPLARRAALCPTASLSRSTDAPAVEAVQF